MGISFGGAMGLASAANQGVDPLDLTYKPPKKKKKKHKSSHAFGNFGNLVAGGLTDTVDLLDLLFPGMDIQQGGTRVDGTGSFRQGLGNLASAAMDALEAGAQNKAAADADASKRAQYAAILSNLDSAMGAPGGGAYTKAEKKSQQKAINNAVLGARAQWDKEIVNARQGFAAANKAMDDTHAKLQPMLTGAARGQVALSDADKQRVAAEQHAAQLAHAAQNEETARQLGMTTPESGRALVDQASQSVELAGAKAAQAQQDDLDRRANTSSNLMGGIKASSALELQEAKDQLQKDTNRQINRLRAGRAASINAAKGDLMTRWSDQAYQAERDNRQYALQRAQMAMGLMQNQQEQENWEKTYDLQRQETAAKSQPSMSDVLAQYAALDQFAGTAKKVPLPDRNNSGNVQYNYVYPNQQQVAERAAMYGLPGFGGPAQGPVRSSAIDAVMRWMGH